VANFIIQSRKSLSPPKASSQHLAKAFLQTGTHENPTRVLITSENLGNLGTCIHQKAGGGGGFPSPSFLDYSHFSFLNIIQMEKSDRFFPFPLMFEL
jgi:hypothetical protein